MSNYIESESFKHAEREMELAGLYEPGADYGGLLTRAVHDLLEAHYNQHHSGFSHLITLKIFNKLANGEPLTDLTDNPEDWLEVGDGVWQNIRQSEAFSRDGGKTYRLNSEDQKIIHGSVVRSEHGN